MNEANTIEAHERSYRIVNPGGLIGAPIANGEPYERRLLEMIYDEHHTGLALDIGAHVGNHTLWLVAVCGLSVVAFEPIHHDRLRDNVVVNGFDEFVTVHACALGDADGWAHLVGKDRLTIALGEPDWSEQVAYQVATLDSFALTDVAVIKIDVEDMEPFVLRGGETTIRRDRPVIYAEARDDACHRLIAEVLEPWGYAMTDRVKVATPVERWSAT